MKKIFVALLLAVVSVTSYAETSYSLSLGNTIGNKQPDGIWWQKPYPSSYQTNATSYTVRVDNSIGNGWSYGVGYTYIGKFRTDSLAVASDQAYAINSPYPLSRWIGNQKQEGIFLVGRKTVGRWYIEAGPMLTKSSFSMHIPDWVPCLDWQMPLCHIPDVANMRSITVGQPKQVKVYLIGGIGYKFNKQWAGQLTFLPTKIEGSLDEDPNRIGGPGVLKGYSPNLSVEYTF